MPYPFRKIAAVFEQKYGGEVQTPSSGSHWKLVLNGKTYPLPAHNQGDEVNNSYISGLCRAFGLDAQEFKGHLQGGKKSKAKKLPAASDGGTAPAAPVAAKAADAADE